MAVVIESLVGRLSTRLRNYERYVVGSGLTTSLDTYLRIVVKAVTAVSVLTIVLYVTVVVVYRPGPLELVIAGIIAVVAVPTTALLIALTVLPRLLYMNRGFKLEARYYRLLFFISLLLISGAGVTRAILGLREFKDELKDFNTELEIIDSRLSLGYDLAEVVDYVASITPSKSLSNLLVTLVSLERSGRAVMPVITSLLGSYFTSLKSRMEEITSYLSMLTEIFIATVLVFPMLVSVISSSATVAPVGGFDANTMLLITLLIVIPIASLLYYIAVDYVLSGVAI